jgi:hypothetical protein
MAELANMALADCGLHPSVQPAPTEDAPNRTVWPYGDDMARKASLLAALRLFGPTKKVRCDDHRGMHRPCRTVPVIDAIQGHTCGAQMWGDQ